MGTGRDKGGYVHPAWQGEPPSRAWDGATSQVANGNENSAHGTRAVRLEHCVPVGVLAVKKKQGVGGGRKRFQREGHAVPFSPGRISVVPVSSRLTSDIVHVQTASSRAGYASTLCVYWMRRKSELQFLVLLMIPTNIVLGIVGVHNKQISKLATEQGISLWSLPPFGGQNAAVTLEVNIFKGSSSRDDDDDDCDDNCYQDSH